MEVETDLKLGDIVSSIVTGTIGEVMELVSDPETYDKVIVRISHDKMSTWYLNEARLLYRNSSAPNMSQIQPSQPISSDRYTGNYPSKEIERMVLDKAFNFKIELGYIPTILRATYEAGYNQAIKDIEEDKEKSKEIPDNSL